MMRSQLRFILFCVLDSPFDYLFHRIFVVFGQSRINNDEPNFEKTIDEVVKIFFDICVIQTLLCL